MPTPITALDDFAGGRLTVDLDAIARNFRRLQELAPAAEVAAVVKADGYGLGATAVAETLAGEGCRSFFVADIAEAARLRETALPASGGTAVYILNGVVEGAGEALTALGLTPVLNTPGDIARWADTARAAERRLPAAIHFDTGIHRLGLTDREYAGLLADPSCLEPLEIVAWMSHLASADRPLDEQNAAQLARFHKGAAEARASGFSGRLSLANSPGVLLGPDYHFDMIRPGIALYGGHPAPSSGGNPFEQVVSLEGRILQVQELNAGDPVGYGGTWAPKQPARIATVSLGYADGFHRAASNRGWGLLGGRRVPIVGKISMDLVTVDVTAVPFSEAFPGAFVTLMGPEVPVDAVADSAGTISYEILTSLGGRYRRRYRGGRSVHGQPEHGRSA